MNRGSREYYRLLFVLSTSLILLLSGCIQLPKKEPEEEIVFDLNTASFYNPKTNTSEHIHVKNLNSSGSFFRHEDQMEIIAGLRDAQGRPGIFINLTLGIIYSWFSQWSEEFNLTKKLGLSVTTNASGIAYLLITYNQWSWPKSMAGTWGSLELSSCYLNNTIGRSKEFSFHFYDKKVLRNTTAEGGLAAIENLENSNLIEEARSLAGTENSYVDWTIPSYGGVTRAIINTTSIKYYTEYRGQPRISIIYIAWAVPFEEMNYTYLSIRSDWTKYIGTGLNGILEDGLSPSYSWLTTGPLAEANITAGWVIFQKIMIDSFSMALDAWGVTVYQISLIATDFQLRWLISRSSEWIS